jgi:hypothetical protein
MDYVEFADRVMRTAAELVENDYSARLSGVNVSEVAHALGLNIEGDFWQSNDRMAILHVIDDLDGLGLATVSGDYMRIEVSDRGRAARTLSLRTSWRAMFAGVQLDEEERALLRAVIARSEDRRERFAVMGEVQLESVFADLGWPADAGRIVSVGGTLLRKGCLHGQAAQFPVRPTYLGVVLATRELETEEQLLLADLLRDWETTTIEAKRELPLNSPKQKHEFVRDILALGTTQGRQRRYLIVGFDPKSRAPFGSVDAALKQDDLEDLLNAYVRGRAPEVRYRTVPWALVTAGLIEVVRDATAVPYRGGPAILERFGAEVFIRRLSHVAIATPEEIAELKAEAAAAQGRLTE